MLSVLSASALANTAVAAAGANAPAVMADEITADLGAVKTVVTYLFEQFGSLVNTIASQPLLLIPVGIFVAGAVIGLAKRLIQG